MCIIELKADASEQAQIDAIHDKVSLPDKTAVEAARTAYDVLTENQKKIVINYQILINAEVRIVVLEDENYEEIPSVTFVCIVLMIAMHCRIESLKCIHLFKRKERMKIAVSSSMM